MNKVKQRLLAIAAFVVATFSMSPAALAVNLPVEFVIPDTTLVVSGYASPGALVSIYDSNTLIGTSVAGSNARFSKEFVALDSGLHNLRLEYVDQSGRSSTPVSNTISVNFQKETSVEYFLPPTLSITPEVVTEGGLVSFSGSTVPGAEVEVNIDGGNTILRPRADSSGNYSITLNTSGYFIGQHPVNAKANFSSQTSYQTDTDNFDVLPVPSSSSVNRPDENLQAPTIVSPPSPFTTDNDEVFIRGTAPPNTQIVIYVDGEPVGSTFSNSEGNWFFNLTLTGNEHTVRAIACFENGCSDFSNSLSVMYTGDFGACSDIFFRLNEYRFWDVSPDSGVDLEFSELGGQAPYEMVIDWGDGVIERFNHNDKNGFKIHHVYRDEGQFNGQVTILDNQGCDATRYFSVDVQARTISTIDLWWLIPLGLILVFIFILRYHHKTYKPKKA